MSGEDSFVEESFTEEGNADQEVEQPLYSAVLSPVSNLSVIPEEDLQSSITERMQAGKSFEEEESSAFGSSCGFARSFTNLSGQDNPMESSFRGGGNQIIDEEQRQYFKDPTRDMALVNAGLMPRSGNGTSWDMGFTTPRKSDVNKKRVLFESPETNGNRIPRSGLSENDKESLSSPPRVHSNDLVPHSIRERAEQDKENLSSPPRNSSNEPKSLPDFSSPPKKKLGAMSRLQAKVESSTPKQERAKVPRPHLDLSAIPGGNVAQNHDYISFADPTMDEQGSLVNKSAIQRVFTSNGKTDAATILELLRSKKALQSGAASQTRPVEISNEGSRKTSAHLPAGNRRAITPEVAVEQQNYIARKQNFDDLPRQDTESIRSLDTPCSSNRKATPSHTLRPVSASSGISSRDARESIVSSTSSKSTLDDPIRIGRSKVIFGCVNVGDSISDVIKLKSNVNEVQRVSVILKKAKLKAFKILNISRSFLLNPNEEKELSIEFSPAEMGRLKGTVIVMSEKFQKTYSIPLYGAGGSCKIRPVETESVRLTSSGYTIITDSLRTITMKIENRRERRAFCAVVLMRNGRRIPCEVKPTPYLLIGCDEVKEIRLTSEEDFSTLEVNSSSGRESSASQFSSVSTSSNKTGELHVVLLYGEDMLRQRLIRFIDATPNGREYRQKYEKDQVKFAAEEFTGNWKEDFAKEWPLSKSDETAFENFLRKVSIRIIPTRGPTVDFDETLKPDSTIMERTFSDMSLVQDVTRRC